MSQTPPPVEPPPAANGPAEADKDARTFGMLCHLLALAGFVVPFGNIIGPLVIWLIKREQWAFVDDQGKESLNFQITVTIAAIICTPLVFIGIGVLLLMAVGIASLVFVILATLQANQGVRYRYPFALRLIK
mgnify:CR=1 FL=1